MVQAARLEDQAKQQVPLFRPVISEEAIAAVTEVLRSGWLGTGPKTSEFEAALAQYAGVPFCVGLNSCTAALHLSLRQPTEQV